MPSVHKHVINHCTGNSLAETLHFKQAELRDNRYGMLCVVYKSVLNISVCCLNTGSDARISYLFSSQYIYKLHSYYVTHFCCHTKMLTVLFIIKLSVMAFFRILCNCRTVFCPIFFFLQQAVALQ